MSQGLFFVIEGSDGSGKTTQFKLLAEKLKSQGHEIASFKFPQYDKPSSHFVSKYLKGDYGPASQINPYAASLFYALDRFEASEAIRDALSAGKIVLSDRYVGANMVHQGGKFKNREEQRGFFVWEDSLEFEILGIPRPTLTIFLRVPAKLSYKLLKERAEAEGTKLDEHEASIEHLENAVDTYDQLCKLFPKDFVAIDCTENGQLLSIPKVNEKVWQTIKPLLPEIADEPVKVRGPLVKQNENGSFSITEAGRSFLKESITSIDGNVYAFTGKLSPLTTAAAMARLSRRGDDMRITLLDEFAAADAKDEELLERIITAYGDDSVQQLAGLHVVVERASNLLTKKLEWGRLAAYLEQSTRYIYYDQRDEFGKYRYFEPGYLEPELAKKYTASLDKIFDIYSEIVHKLTDYIQARSKVPEADRDGPWRAATRAQACDAARGVLPVATQSTVGIFASGQALESLIIHLLSDELPEAQAAGRQLLEESRKVLSSFLQRADLPERGGAAQGYRAFTFQAVKELANRYLPPVHSNDQAPVRLTSYWPANELDLVPDMLYEHSDLSLKELQQIVQGWPYKQRVKVFKQYMGERFNRRHRPGRALENAHYSWDLVCDYGIFRDLQRHRMVDDLEWQPLSPRFGYDVPALVEEAGLSEPYSRCFDISLELFSALQAKGYLLEAQYAVLFGHKMRWKVTYNARQAFHLHELRTTPQGHPGYRKLVKAMHDRLAEVHPLLASSMIFVNKDEDPELARLAAERYSQAKLAKLDQKFKANQTTEVAKPKPKR